MIKEEDKTNSMLKKLMDRNLRLLKFVQEAGQSSKSDGIEESFDESLELILDTLLFIKGYAEVGNGREYMRIFQKLVLPNLSLLSR